MERDAERVAERLRTFRRRAGLSQAGLAERASVARSTVARLELGEGNPDLATLSKLARALGVPTYELLEGGR